MATATAEQILAFAKWLLLSKLETLDLPSAELPLETKPRVLLFTSKYYWDIEGDDGTEYGLSNNQRALPHGLSGQIFSSNTNAIPVGTTLDQAKDAIYKYVDEVAKKVKDQLPPNVKHIRVLGNVTTVWEKHMLEFKLYYA